MKPLLVGLAISIWCGWLWSSTARGMEPENAPFNGQWSLDFRVDTRPGGETFTTRQGGEVSAYELHFQASRGSFRLQDDRSLKLDILESSSLIIRSTTRFGAVTMQDRQRHRGRMHIEGAGSGEQDDRRLKLTIRWGLSSGVGISTDSFGTSQTTRSQMSADGTQLTLSNEAGTGTFAFDLWKSEWELKPSSLEKREVSSDVIVETATYEGRRNTRLAPLDPGGFSPPLPVTEEIELKQVRQLKLVPRG